MKIPAQNSTYSAITDTSQECAPGVAFLLTQLSARYKEDAIARGCQDFLYPEDLHNHLNTDIAIIGITGTNGKTTTGAAIYSFLLDLGYRCAFQGTRGFYIGEERVEGKSLTTPLVMQSYFHIHQAAEAGCKYFVMEVSSHAIAQNRIEAIPFALKVLTNITQDHLDFHQTMENYIATKNRFFDSESLKLTNVDEKKAHPPLQNLRSYGIENGATYKIDAYSLTDGLHGVVTHGQEQVAFSSPLFGHHNLYNLLAAMASVHLLTHRPLQEIADVAENFAGVSGRLEVVNHNPLILVDFAHTDDGMEKVLESFKERSILVVFGAGGDRDRAKRPRMGNVADRYADHIIITSDNPRSEEPEAIANDILEGVQNREKTEIILDRREAIIRAIALQQDGQVLLVLGKGDEETQEIRGVKLPFDDREVIRECLNTQTTSSPLNQK